MKTINTINAPEALGPYSQAIEHNGVVYLSGQIPLNPQTKSLEISSIEAATNQVFNNIEAVLQECNLTLNDVVKVSIFIQDLQDFDRMNIVYANRFGNHRPARSCVEVARLPKDVPIEIEVIAVK